MTKAAEEVWTESERLSGEPRDTDGCIAYALLLISAIVGPNIVKCAAALSVPRNRIRWMARNLRENKVWDGNSVCVNWLDPETGGAALALDASVALGLLKREPS